MEWVELNLFGGELAEEVGAILASGDDDPAEEGATASAGVEIQGQHVVMWVPADKAETAEKWLRRQAARLAEAGFPVDPSSVRARSAAPEEDWRDAWKRWFKTVRIGARLLIVPSWETYAPRPGEVVLDLDPGRAFGTGAHASTRLCLIELERRGDEGTPPARILDVGTGSGILAIAAARLWPESTGVALDVDPQAVDAACENLERNGVAGRVELKTGGNEGLSGTFDVVVANLQADVLADACEGLVGALAAEGRLILSGILAPQASALSAQYEAAGLTSVRAPMLPDDEDWIALVLDRP